MAYTDKVLEHYQNPRNVGSFAKDEDNVGTGVVVAPECGDVMKLQLKINPRLKSSKLRALKLLVAGLRLHLQAT